jgi:hypothetical protein
MKNALVAIILLMCCVHSLAQQGDHTTIPSTPAFSILNFEPAAVMRPSNPKELSADIINSFDENGNLLMNLGLEVAPYWLKSHPNLTTSQYLNPTDGQLFWQSLMLSAATVKDSASNSNKLGLGVRVRLKQGDLSPEFSVKQGQLRTVSKVMVAVNSGRGFASTFSDIDALVSFIDSTLQATPVRPDTLEWAREVMGRLKPNYGNSTSELRRFAEDVNTALANESESLRKDVVELSKKRIGWLVEAAAASSFITSESDQFEKLGLWLNWSRVFSTTDALVISGRGFISGKDSVTTNGDFALSYIKERPNFSFSAELVGRYYSAKIPDFNIDGDPITRLEEDFTYRLAVQAAYKIGEDISINLSLGKDFDAPFLERSGFFSIFGVNYNIFKNHRAAAPTVTP